MEKYGIDVSSHQGKIDWGKVKKDFAILRAGWSWYQGGMNIDTRFLENAAGVQAAGIPWGVYLYAYDKTPAAARIAANRLADLLDDYKLDYPVAYDFEDNQYLATGKASNTAICKAFLDTIRARGYYPILYTYTSFAMSYLEMDKLTEYDFWVADYTGKVGWPGAYSIWQRSAKGQVDGISTAVDLNTAYKDYPTIIREAGLNGYDKPVDDGSKIAELEAEVATLTAKVVTLEAKIERAQTALA